MMVPLYAARIEDLGPSDLVKVDCGACGHTALLGSASLSRLRLSPHHKVLDLYILEAYPLALPSPEVSNPCLSRCDDLGVEYLDQPIY